MANGHVRKRGKTWSYVHYVSDAATGKRRQTWKGGFATKRDAARALREAMGQIDRGVYVEPTKLTVGEYLTKHWLPMINVEYSTWESYERNIRLHVIPNIGAIRLPALRPSDLNKMYKHLQGTERGAPVRDARTHHDRVYELVRQGRARGDSYAVIADAIRGQVPGEDDITKDAVAGIWKRMQERRETAPAGTLSAKTIRYIHSILSGAFEAALKEGWVGRNVVRLASPPPPAKSKPKRVLWSAEEMRRFFGWLRDEEEHRLWPAWIFVATSGDRRGANLGLHWSDVDLDRGVAALTWTVTAVRHRIVVKPYTKTGEGHEILLDKTTVTILRWWRARQNEARLAYGSSHTCVSPEPGCELSGYHARDLVFCRPDGDYLHPDRFTREFQRAQRRYNRQHPDEALPVISIHALRHGWATLALEAGIPMKVVQDRLNHSSEKVTADIYTQVRKAVQSDAAERVAAEIFGPAGHRRFPRGS